MRKFHEIFVVLEENIVYEGHGDLCRDNFNNI